MNSFSKKHWIALFGVIILEILIFILPNFGTIVPVLQTLICFLIIHSFLKESLKEYGLHFTRIPTQILSGIVLAAVILYLVYGNHIYLGVSAMNERFFKAYPSLLSVFLYMLNMFIFAMAEEVVFRGFLLTSLQKLFRCPYISIIVSSFLFGISHYPASHDWNKVIITSVIGFIYSYLRTKEPQEFSLFSLTITHFLYNFGLAFIIGPY